MTNIDIIPDIHGNYDKLQAALAGLDWKRTGAGWSNPETERELVFLGDYIDRGPDNRRVIETVRDLVDSGKATAVMGNHELNALHFHTLDPETGVPLRARSGKNTAQHASFLSEFPIGGVSTRAVIEWMQTLPLFYETPEFRAVHACWDNEAISSLKGDLFKGKLSDEQVVKAASKTDPFAARIETILKGPEISLPDGQFFFDKGGDRRQHVRLNWWNPNAKTWRQAAMSVPDASSLPEGELPNRLITAIYPTTDKPVFFGHYWLTGAANLQAQNALCLDYSVGKGGPLVTYRFDGAQLLDLKRVRVFK